MSERGKPVSTSNSKSVGPVKPAVLPTKPSAKKSPAAKGVGAGADEPKAAAAPRATAAAANSALPTPSAPASSSDPRGVLETLDSQPPVPSSATGDRPSLPPVGSLGQRARVSDPRVSVRPSNVLTGYDLPLDQASLKQGVASHIEYTQGKDEFSATRLDYFFAVARTTRDRLFDRWNKTQQSYYRKDRRRVYYLSLEFLLGRLLEDALLNLGIFGEMQGALKELGLDLADLSEAESDAGLGNGGLGRLAACFLDSMATMGVPGMGYGIRYDYGIFEQAVVDGRQVERADSWLRYGSPWEVPRPEQRYRVRLGGWVRIETDAAGRQVFRWVDTEDVWAMAYDVLVPGYGNDVVNTLRLWAARATRDFQFSYFNDGDYIRAVEEKNASENISRVLYPNDMVAQGRQLRLKQEYFFVSATIQDALERHKKAHTSLGSLPDSVVFQLNDTHPALAILELMRLLIDEHGFGWDEAFDITSRCFAYTNHTVLPEALETWPVTLLEKILPRHLQIAYEINRRFLEAVQARFPGDEARIARMSLFGEVPEKVLRMAHLSIVGSFSVNGVSELHGRILRDRLFRDFAELWPKKFGHVTNGITPRRWLLKCNASLAELLTSELGERWITDLGELSRLVPLAGRADFRDQWREVKKTNKIRLSNLLQRVHGVKLDPDALLDVHVKRLHEYKRQLLNILHVASLYLAIRSRAPRAMSRRTFLFAGKAAPGYATAKLIIELILAVADTIAKDPVARELLQVVFVPNYSVSLAELIIPAADLSEQISLAGTEASGTGNMKLALNGALTIGTLDGATVEMAEAIGRDNLFLFGLTAAEVEGVRARGYDPRQTYVADPEVRVVLDALAQGVFSPGDPTHFAPLVESLLTEDRYLVLADFRSYRNCHQGVQRAFANQELWTRKSIATTAAMGRFSSDTVIRNYAEQIWRMKI